MSEVAKTNNQKDENEKEIIKNLDMLLEYEIINSEDDWESIGASKPEELDDKEKES